ncbi:MAG: TRAP transporter substrate-binding protein [Burkholderiales bacterium]|nr:TRAP transporter substrate-binding protein [Burkholderiales bacterium]
MKNALFLLLVLAGAAAAQTLPAGPKVTVTAVTQLSPALPQYKDVDVPMLRDKMPAASNGRIVFNLKSYPEMNVQGPEVIRLVRSGQVDLAGAPLTTVSGDVPLLDGFDLPGLHTSMEQVRRAGHALMPTANKELEKLGVRVIATSPFPAQVFFCKQPVRSIADLKGRKIRVAGPSQGDFLNALGAQPVAIAFGEVYTALERGTVDCAVTGTGTGNAQKWYEVASNLYTLVASWGISGYMVNIAWWNKLDPQVRGFLEKYFQQVEETQWKLGSQLTQDGIDCNAGNAAGCKIFTLLTDRKMTVVRPSDADNALARKVLVDVVLPNWVKRCGARCGEAFNASIAPLAGVKYQGN